MENSLQKAKSECNVSLTGRSQIVKAFEETKIKDLSDDEIKNVLKYIFVLIGLRNFPDNTEQVVLLQFTRENYGFYGLSELKIAFEMAIKKQFECETKHYESFSPSYLAQVINGYSEYRSRIAKEYMIEKQRIKDEQEENREISEEEKQKLKKDFFDQVLKPLFDNYKEKKKLNFGLTPVRIVYMTLRDDYKVINLSDQEMIQIKEKAKEELDDKVKTCKMTGQKKTKKEIWTELCRIKAIELSFDYLISNKKELKF